MQTPDYQTSPYPVRSDISAVHRRVWEGLGRPGTHWTGAERVAIAAAVRSARAESGGSRATRTRARESDRALPAIAVEAARAIAVDAARIDRKWFRGIVDALGAGAYVELVAVVVQVTAIDAFGEALGVALEPLPPAQLGAATATESINALFSRFSRHSSGRKPPAPMNGAARTASTSRALA